MSPTTHSLPEKRIQRIVKESEGQVITCKNSRCQNDCETGEGCSARSEVSSLLDATEYNHPHPKTEKVSIYICMYNDPIYTVKK